MSFLVKQALQYPILLSLGLLAAAGGVRFLKAKRQARKQEKGRLRSLSFSSEVLVDGAFPAPARVNQAVVNILFHMDKVPSVEKLQTRIRHLIAFDRFRATARKVGGSWELYDLGIDNEVEKRIVETVECEDEEAIKKAVDRLCLEDIPYDSDRPLWRAIRLVNNGTGRSSVLFRLHHVIGDGIALVGVMSALFDKENGDPFTLDIPQQMGGSKKAGFSLSTVWTFITSLVSVLTVASSRHDTDIAFVPDHSESYYLGEKKSHAVRKTMYFPVLRLDFIKELKNKGNVTINDVLMAATSGMLRKYSHLKKDGKVVNLSDKTNLQVRALLPVAFPRPKKDQLNKTKAMRNLFSMISVPLTVNETTPKERLLACAKITTALKSSPSAIIQLFVQNYLIAYAPQFIQQKIAFDAFSRHSIVFSNVPGPSEAISLCGEKISGVNVVFPNLLPQIIIISYNGGIHFTLSADPAEVDDSVLPGLLMEELKSMAQELGVSTDNMTIHL